MQKYTTFRTTIQTKFPQEAQDITDFLRMKFPGLTNAMAVKSFLLSEIEKNRYELRAYQNEKYKNEGE